MFQGQVTAVGCKGGVLFPHLWCGHPSASITPAASRPRDVLAAAPGVFARKQAGEAGVCIDSVRFWGSSQLLAEPSPRWKLTHVPMQVWKGNSDLLVRKWMEMGKKESTLERWGQFAVAYSSKWKGNWEKMVQEVSDLYSELNLQF